MLCEVLYGSCAGCFRKKGKFIQKLFNLYLVLPAVDNSDEVVEGQSDIVVYNLSGTDLVRIIDAQASSKRTDGTKTLLSELDDLDFVYEVEANPAQSTWVNITLTKQVATYNDVNTIDVSNRVFLKNKE